MNKRVRKLIESNGGNDVIFDGSGEKKPLLEDFFWLEVKPGDLVEEKGNDGKNHFYLNGRFGLVEVATANRRLYPRKLIEREVSRLSEAMAAKKVYGELDHPSDGKTKFSRVSHFVLGATINENNEIIGRIEIIPGTKNGDQALAIAKAGGTLGVSSRGFGSVVPDAKGNHVVQEDYKLVTWDIVADPANAGAHPDFVVEDKEGLMDIEKFIRENPELIKRLKADLREEVEPEARDHARVALQAEVERQLKEEGETIRQEAVEQAKETLLNDPEVAAAKTVVESIKELVSPFLFEGDENKEIIRLKDKIRTLEERVANRDKKVHEQTEELKRVSSIAKELGYNLYMERELGENADTVKSRIGDVNRFDTIEDFQEAIEEVLEQLKEEEEERVEQEAEVAKLKAEVEQLKEQRDRALSVSHKFGLRAYLEKKIAGHPKAPALREHVESVNPQKKEDIDRLIATYNRENPLSEEYQRIRRGLKRSTPTDDFKSNTPDSLVEDQEVVMGVPMDLLKTASERL